MLDMKYDKKDLKQYVPALVKARYMIESGWTQGAFARDINGNEVLELSPRACSYCLLGAIHVGVNNISIPPDLYHYIHSLVPEQIFVAKWNDTPNRTKEEVITFLDEVIESLDV